jgi:polyhydroxyalkanoate synthesis repressor PhaR
MALFPPVGRHVSCAKGALSRREETVTSSNDRRFSHVIGKDYPSKPVGRRRDNGLPCQKMRLSDNKGDAGTKPWPAPMPATMLSKDRNGHMAKSQEPVTIKKYANRRLYNTGTSAYVTLEDLAAMVKEGEDFVVYDAKSGDDITRSVLTQIIFEQEGKDGQNLLPITFLRQLIRFYGDSIQMMVPRYLEVSMDSFTRERGKFRDQMAQAFGVVPGAAMFEEQTRRNMEMFERAFAMFSPFAKRGEQPAQVTEAAGTEIDDLKRQMADMQRKLEKLSGSDKPK